MLPRVLTLLGGKKKLTSVEADILELFRERLETIDSKLDQVLALAESNTPIYETFDIDMLRGELQAIPFVTVANNIDTTRPITVVHNSLHQILGIDFTIQDNKIDWINAGDPLDYGTLEVTYYKLLAP